MKMKYPKSLTPVGDICLDSAVLSDPADVPPDSVLPLFVPAVVIYAGGEEAVALFTPSEISEATARGRRHSATSAAIAGQAESWSRAASGAAVLALAAAGIVGALLTTLLS
jgi:hypothetical protein